MIHSSELSNLQNIIQFIKPTNIFSYEDKSNITEMIADLISIYIKEDPLSFQYENFDETLFKNIYNQSFLQINHLYNEDISDELTYLINKTIHKYFTYIIPKRCIKSDKIKYLSNKNKIKSKLLYLSNVPQPEQRTTEWYLFRHKYLTASSIWKAFSSQGNINHLIYNKCIPIDITKYTTVNIDSPLHWGQKFEDLSILWYEYTYKTKVDDFGCIGHKDIDFIAASPDGINVMENSDRYGRMLEVKNIVNRKITQIPKFEYWIQMQVQMEVCDLNECDFLETRFIEYDNYHDFNNDGSFQLTKSLKPKGIFVMFLDNESKPVYKYPPWNLSQSEFNSWNDKILNQYKDYTWFKNIYWYLDEVSVVLVIRNKLWFSAAKEVLTNLWKTICYEKKHGYEHRQPKKRSSNKLSSSNKCLLNLSTNLTFNIDTT
jgi:putative phage-type endonuclease